MIVCIDKAVDVQPLIDRNPENVVLIDFNLEEELKQDKSILGVAQLLNDIGKIVVLRVGNIEELRKTEDYLNNTPELNVIYVSSFATKNGMLSSSQTLYRQSLFSVEFNSLEDVLDYHYYMNPTLYTHQTTKYEFIMGCARDEEQFANMYTENIFSVYRDKEVNNTMYFLEVDIRDSKELLQMAQDFSITEITNKENVLDVDFKLCGTYSSQYMEEIIERVQEIISLSNLFNYY